MTSLYKNSHETSEETEDYPRSGTIESKMSIKQKTEISCDQEQFSISPDSLS